MKIGTHEKFVSEKDVYCFTKKWSKIIFFKFNKLFLFRKKCGGCQYSFMWFFQLIFVFRKKNRLDKI